MNRQQRARDFVEARHEPDSQVRLRDLATEFSACEAAEAPEKAAWVEALAVLWDAALLNQDDEYMRISLPERVTRIALVLGPDVALVCYRSYLMVAGELPFKTIQVLSPYSYVTLVEVSTLPVEETEAIEGLHEGISQPIY